jgi:hypothetical protein
MRLQLVSERKNLMFLSKSMQLIKNLSLAELNSEPGLIHSYHGPCRGKYRILVIYSNICLKACRLIKY